MADSSSPMLPFLRRIVDDLRADGADHDLLRRFADEREQVAFEAILVRHGPMVFDVCRNVLACEADAEDAFQATFLVLATKAGSIHQSHSLASWLYGVAYRASLKARSRGRRRREAESATPPKATTDPIARTDTDRVLHEELGGLPECYRAPLILCHLRGHTQDEAANLLGLSKGTLKRRLESGRTRLRERLIRRGLTSASILVGSIVSQAANAQVPPSLFATTLENAPKWLTASGTVPVQVAALTTGVMNAMRYAYFKSIVLAVLLGGTLLIGGGVGIGKLIGAGQTDEKTPPSTGKEAPMNADRPLAPEAIVEKKFAGKATVEFQIGVVGLMQTNRLTRIDESLPLLITPKTTGKKSPVFVHVSWETATQLKRLGLDPVEFLRGKTIRIRGEVEALEGSSGPKYRIQITSLEQLEIVELANFDGVWSQSVNGLQVRLAIVEKSPINGTRSLIPYLELRNTNDSATPLKVTCDPVKFELIDEDRKMVDEGWSLPRDGPHPSPGIVSLPFDSSIRINMHCTNWGVPGNAAAMIATDSGAWILKAEHKRKVFLRATLRVEAKNPDLDGKWSGTIQTLPLRIDWPDVRPDRP